MPIHVSCSCGKHFSANDELAGRQVKCPVCGGVIPVPSAQNPVGPNQPMPGGNWQQPAPVMGTAPAQPVSGGLLQRIRRPTVELSPIVKVGLFLFSGLFLLSGPVSGIVALGMISQANAAADWPTTEGLVESSEVYESGVGRYKAMITYHYDVDGRTHYSRQVRRTDGEYSVRDGAQQIVNRYSAGQAVTVYYDPSDASSAVLEAGAGFGEYSLIFVAFVMFCIGAGGLVFGFIFVK